jgi:hypothetical protein
MASGIRLSALFISALAASPGVAGDTSYLFEGSYGAWRNHDGGRGIDPNFGLAGKDDRRIGSLSFGVGRDFGTGFTGLAKIAGSTWSSADASLDQDDSTTYTLDLTLRGYWETANGLRYSGFVGLGRHDDDGDSDQDMGYFFIGADATKQTSFGNVFAQFGVFESYDQYSEGTHGNAPFLRLGGVYDLSDLYALTGSVAWAGGDKYDSNENNRTLNAELGLERRFDTFTGFARYEWTQISYDFSGARYGDTFETIVIGLRFDLGGKIDTGPDIAPIGRWVAYNANEIE